MRLLEAIEIRNLRVRNRVVMPAMTTRLAAANGAVTEEILAHYETRARGGVGLVTVELASPLPGGRHRRREVGIWDDQFLPGLKQLATRIKQHGAAASLQIGHAGSHARSDVTGEKAVAPSTVPHVVQEGDWRVVTPRALAATEIQKIVASYAEAAARLKRAGFDALELQGAHDYLIAQFLSPWDNRRHDAYGGDLKGRARFSVEVVQAVRAAVGEMPIFFRMNGDEYVPGGFGVDDARELAVMLEQAGVDALHVSAGCARSRPYAMIIFPPMSYPPATFVHLAKAVKAKVKVPVVAVGRLGNPGVAEAVLQARQADMIALGRALLADPEWVNKVQAGKMDEIRPCIACNTCISELRGGHHVVCLINPAPGAEPRSRPERRILPRRVMVVGAGPVGMTVAAHLASRGHQVDLYERENHVGGQLRLATKAPIFQDVGGAEGPLLDYIAYLERMTRKAGVQVHLGVSVTAQDVMRVRADVVILAIGASFRRPVGSVFELILRSGLAKRWPFARLARRPLIKKLLLYSLRVPNDGLETALQRAGIDVRRVGECQGPRGMLQALRDTAELLDQLG